MPNGKNADLLHATINEVERRGWQITSASIDTTLGVTVRAPLERLPTGGTPAINAIVITRQLSSLGWTLESFETLDKELMVKLTRPRIPE